MGVALKIEGYVEGSSTVEFLKDALYFYDLIYCITCLLASMYCYLQWLVSKKDRNEYGGNFYAFSLVVLVFLKKSAKLLFYGDEQDSNR